ncbi:NAD(P)/FAD-dependent oxidoreductase [Pannus brasiliensis CCIBt3594]|uniref:NAD(P)/FAD-dependent oxidoreductase n=1 Tax=Pannus brasiliensis CCIBt3594 TaxID=1427578 RepID=A0AAW9QW31_9CHRO
MHQEPIEICIVGGGFGGLYTALSLSGRPAVRSGQWRITLIEPKDHFLFTPLLYELITGELQRWEIAPSYRQLLAGTKIRWENRACRAIDFPNRQVRLDDGESVRYDYLVLAAGTRNRIPAIEGLAEHALTFRSLEDVERLQNTLHLLETETRAPARVAVIGGGPNGVELACKVADRLGDRGKVTLIERNSEILLNFSKGVRVASYRSLLARDITLYLNTALEKVTANSIVAVKGDIREILDADLVIWTAGTEARDWIAAIDRPKNDRGQLFVRPTLQLLDDPEVFAVGDIAEIYGGKQRIPATAQAAYQASAIVASNLVGAIEKRSLKTYRYLHLGDMLTLGRKRALVSSFGLNIGGRLADITRRFVYILRLPTKRQKIKVLQHWLKNILLKFRYKRGISRQPIESRNLR